jgi:hypothetical protein
LINTLCLDKALTKFLQLLKAQNDERTVASLAQLKIAFDNAESAQPGITHQMIAHIIETLKSNSANRG